MTSQICALGDQTGPPMTATPSAPTCPNERRRLRQRDDEQPKHEEDNDGSHQRAEHADAARPTNGIGSPHRHVVQPRMGDPWLAERLPRQEVRARHVARVADELSDPQVPPEVGIYLRAKHQDPGEP